MEKGWCQECKAQTVEDNVHDGMGICQSCGLAQHILLSDEPEWHNYEDDKTDCARVGQEERLGMPRDLELATFIDDPNHTTVRHPDEDRLKMYSDQRRELQRACQSVNAETLLPTVQEMFGIYRECVPIIHHQEGVHAALIYQASLVNSRPIPIMRLCEEFGLSKRHVVLHLKTLRKLLKGEQDNSPADCIVTSQPKRGREFTHLLPKCQQDTLAFIEYLCNEFDAGSSSAKLMRHMYKLFTQRYMHSQKSPETVAGGICYQVFRSKGPTNIVRLSHIAHKLGISESSITAMTQLLPPCPTKRKR